MSAIRVTLRGVPPSLNRFAGRLNSWDYRNEKTMWTQAVEYAVRTSRSRPAHPFERAEVEIMYYFPTAARHDPDNYAGKFLLDGLTKSGVIADDSFAHITLSVGGAVDRKEPRTVITVREVMNDGEKAQNGR